MIQTILDRLDRVQSRGGGQYMARCPYHDDNNPSLSLVEAEDGRVLMKCFAGCAPVDILHSIGLDMGDLFPEGAKSQRIKGWFKAQEEIQQRKTAKQNDKLQREREILEIAASMRRQGERLTPKDLERERQADLRLRNADNNR